MKQSIKRICAGVTAMAMILTSYVGSAGENYTVKAAGTAAVSANIHRENYWLQSAVNDTYAKPVTSYLYEGDADTLVRVELIDSSIVVEQYGKSNFEFQSTTQIPMELSVFGGFYAGENYNYMVFGQENSEEDDTCEVIRVVQYTKDWTRVSSDSVYGANTVVPFDGGSLRMCEVGDMLYIRTCHEMYMTSDGCNHQANMTLCYNSSTKQITDESNTVVGGIGYVSHSFNQFIEADGKDLVTVDHGDGYPRAIVLMKYKDGAGAEAFDKSEEKVNLFTFPGDDGDNYTGASVGGLEVSSTNYLTAYNTVDQEYFYGWVRNVCVASTNKDDMTVQTTQYTSFTATGAESASNPILVEVSENEFMLMWEVYDADEVCAVDGNPGTHTIQYVKLDGEGKALGEVNTATGDLSDCQPLVLENKIVWYVTDNSAPVFYSLDADTEQLTSTSQEQNVEIGPAFYADTATAYAGSEISVTLKVKENPGMMGFGVNISYDKDVLTPIDDVKASSLLSGQFVNSIERTLAEDEETFKVIWAGTENMSENGELFTMKFKVADGATGSTQIGVTVSQEDTFDADYNDVVFACEPVRVIISEGTAPEQTSAPATPTQSPGTSESSTSSTNSKKNTTISTSSSKSTVYYWVTKPAKVKLKSLKKAGKKKLKVTWKWNVEADGYQIQYAQNKKFTKKKKTKNVASWKENYTLKGLKSKKIYYVRVRAYKRSSGGKVYGSWSKVKKCKVK